MLWTIIALLFVFWLVGLIVHLAGPLIHVALVLAIVLFIFNLVMGRRTMV